MTLMCETGHRFFWEGITNLSSRAIRNFINNMRVTTLTISMTLTTNITLMANMVIKEIGCYSEVIRIMDLRDFLESCFRYKR